jgi:hypothetical protein
LDESTFKDFVVRSSTSTSYNVDIRDATVTETASIGNRFYRKPLQTGNRSAGNRFKPVTASPETALPKMALDRKPYTENRYELVLKFSLPSEGKLYYLTLENSE